MMRSNSVREVLSWLDSPQQEFLETGDGNQPGYNMSQSLLTGTSSIKIQQLKCNPLIEVCILLQ